MAVPRARAHGLPQAINVDRFRRLLAFLAENHHDFRVETVGELAQRLPLPPATPRLRFPRGRPSLRLLRFGEQLKKRALALTPS